MEHKQFSSLISTLIGILSLSFLVIIHEFGHFIACKLFHVATPVFSLGFGPKLIGTKIGSTLYQIALLPLGGYVSINQQQLQTLSYLPLMIIMLAGVFVNFLFAFVLFFAVRRHGVEYGLLLRELSRNYGYNGFIGPIGIISLLGKSINYGVGLFCYLLALLSLNLGIFNLLPFPFLDGSKALAYTLNRFMGDSSAASLLYTIITILMICILMLGIVFKRRSPSEN